jgi:uncharacterized protein YqjF (DUF2071 family)
MTHDEFLTAEWRYLAMLNYEVDPSTLRGLVPRGTELDFWEGRAYVSVVGFLFLDTRVLGMSIPMHRNFEEVNLRFYVRRKGPEGWRRGVVFIKEIVPRFAIATVARVVYNENYVSMPMRHRIDMAGETLAENRVVEYGWESSGGNWNTLTVKSKGAPAPLVAGSEEEFITEHYWGYAAQRDGGCVEYRVEHPAWRVWSVESPALRCDVAGIYGEEFAGPLAAEPRSAFLAEGSPIIVRKGVRIE